MRFPRCCLQRSLFVCAAALAAAAAAPAQDISAVIAGLREDVRILDERTRSLTVEIEQLKRENAALRSQSTTGSYVTMAQFNQSLSDLEKALRAGDREVALQLTQQLEKLARQTQSAIDALAKSPGARAPAPSVQFTEDYPKKGVTYTVQPGDTLASIAQKFSAQIRDIQNANKIGDPRTLQAGQTLFIPQR